MPEHSSNAITVAEALDLEVLRQGEATLLAGRRNLDNPIRWAHISDLAAAAPSLKGGELLLTHGLSVRRSAAIQRRYIEELASVPIAGLVIELGRGFDRVPPAMVHEAQARQLPLIALNRRIRFVDLTEGVHRRILGRHYELVEEAQSLGNELMAVPGRGAGLAALLEVLAAGLGNPVVLEDAAHEVVDYADPGRCLGDELENWAAHSYAHRSAASGEEGAAVRCVVEPIGLRGQLWGRLHVLELQSPLTDQAALSARHAAWAAMLVLLQESNVSSLARHAGGNLIEDILARRLSPEEIRRKAKALGAELSTTAVPLAVEVHAAGATASDREMSGLLERIAEKVGAAMWKAFAERPLSKVDPQRGLVLFVAGAGTGEGPLVAAAARGVRGALEGTAWQARIGVGEQVEAEQLAASLEHAREAAALAGDLGDVGVARYRDLGMDRLFLKLAEGPELAAFVDAELGPLLEHDASSSNGLIPVLEAYLASGGSKSEAARSLFIGRRSLYYKLAMIEELLDCSLDDIAKRTNIAVALQGLRTMQTRSAARRG